MRLLGIAAIVEGLIFLGFFLETCAGPCMFGHVNSPKALTQIQCGPVLAHRAAFFRSVQSSTADTAMTCLRAEPGLRCCPCRCEKSIATLHGTVRGSFNQAGVFSARKQWTTKSKRRESHDVWCEEFQAWSVRRQLLSGRALAEPGCD